MLVHRLKDRSLITKAYRDFTREHLALKNGKPVYPAWEAMLRDDFGGAKHIGKDLMFASETHIIHFKLRYG